MSDTAIYIEDLKKVARKFAPPQRQDMVRNIRKLFNGKASEAQKIRYSVREDKKSLGDIRVSFTTKRYAFIWANGFVTTFGKNQVFVGAPRDWANPALEKYAEQLDNAVRRVTHSAVLRVVPFGKNKKPVTIK